jgi:hypothetical protein
MKRKRVDTSTRRLLDAALGRRSKFGAKATIVDGKRFASRKEARRYQELVALERAGRIEQLKTQVRYRLVQTVVYVADFVYVENGETVVEDTKGFKTPTYKQKRRLMLDQHGIEIRES